MRIFMSPQVNNKEIEYNFKENIVEVTIGSATDVFDFSGLPNGRLELEDEQGNDLIETELEIQPILSVEKKEGILYLELLQWIPENARYKDRFPEWIDAKDYEPPGIESEEEVISGDFINYKNESKINSKDSQQNSLEDWSDF